jgi:hypothetical protein
MKEKYIMLITFFLLLILIISIYFNKTYESIGTSISWKEETAIDYPANDIFTKELPSGDMNPYNLDLMKSTCASSPECKGFIANPTNPWGWSSGGLVYYKSKLENRKTANENPGLANGWTFYTKIEESQPQTTPGTTPGTRVTNPGTSISWKDETAIDYPANDIFTKELPSGDMNPYNLDLMKSTCASSSECKGFIANPTNPWGWSSGGLVYYKSKLENRKTANENPGLANGWTFYTKIEESQPQTTPGTTPGTTLLTTTPGTTRVTTPGTTLLTTTPGTTRVTTPGTTLLTTTPGTTRVTTPGTTLLTTTPGTTPGTTLLTTTPGTTPGTTLLTTTPGTTRVTTPGTTLLTTTPGTTLLTTTPGTTPGTTLLTTTPGTTRVTTPGTTLLTTTPGTTPGTTLLTTTPGTTRVTTPGTTPLTTQYTTTPLITKYTTTPGTTLLDIQYTQSIGTNSPIDKIASLDNKNTNSISETQYTMPTTPIQNKDKGIIEYLLELLGFR